MNGLMLADVSEVVLSFPSIFPLKKSTNVVALFAGMIPRRKRLH